MASTLTYGISSTELETSIKGIAPSQSSACFVVGTAPVHRILGGSKNVNKPILANNARDYTLALGDIDKDFARYTLCEHAHLAFNLFGTGPHIYVNVLDPKKHIGAPQTFNKTFADQSVQIDIDGVLDTLTVESDSKKFEPDKDYIATYINDRQTNKPAISITRLGAGAIEPNAAVKITVTPIAPEKITTADIIGGYDSGTDTYIGLAAIDTVFHAHNIVPTIIVVPGELGTKPETIAAIKTRTRINDTFTAWSPIQASTSNDGAKQFAQANALKNRLNVTDPHLDFCFGYCGLGADTYSLATQYALLTGLVDTRNNNLPFASPSNNNLQMDKLCLADGTEISMTKSSGDLLRSQGIVTALNWANGWKLYGTQTSAFPFNTDYKDQYRSVRRMIDFIQNEIVLLLWQNIDKPVNQRLLETIVQTVQSYLDYLTKMGALIGSPRFRYRNQDNTNINLVSSQYNFYLEACPPGPLQSLRTIIAINIESLQTLAGRNS